MSDVGNRRISYINGAWLPEGSASVSLFDSAIATGDMVVEVARTFGGKLFRLDEHLDRLFSGLAELDIALTLSRSNLADIAYKLLDKNIPSECYPTEWQIVFYVSRGLETQFDIFESGEITPTLAVVCFPIRKRIARIAPKYRHGVDLIVPSQPAIPSTLLSPQIKSRGRMDFRIARLQVKRTNPSAWGAMVNPDGNLVEGTGTNLFFVMGSKLLAPPNEDAMRGVTREAIIEIARDIGLEFSTKKIPVRLALESTEIFVTSTIVGIVHARSLNNHLIGNGEIGPVTRTLRENFIHYVGDEFVTSAERFSEYYKL